MNPPLTPRRKGTETAAAHDSSAPARLHCVSARSRRSRRRRRRSGGGRGGPWRAAFLIQLKNADAFVTRRSLNLKPCPRKRKAFQTRRLAPQPQPQLI